VVKLQPVPLFFTVVLAYACNDDRQVSATPPNPVTPIEASALKDYTISDSAIQEDSRIVYGALRFGMTKDEVNALPEEDVEPVQFIGGREYTFVPSFSKSGMLYRLVINGKLRNGKYFDTEIKQDLLGLTEMISMVYGEPQILSSYPLLKNMKQNSPIWGYKWTADRKVILIGIGQADKKSYHAVCWIYDDNMLQLQESKDSVAGN